MNRQRTSRERTFDEIKTQPMPWITRQTQSLCPSYSFDRYQNVKSELEAQQKLERIRAERQSSSMGRVSAPAVHKKATTKHSATGGGGARGGRRSSKHGA